MEKLKELIIAHLELLTRDELRLIYYLIRKIVRR